MKAVNTPEEVLEESKRNGDKEFVALLHKKHSLDVKDLNEPNHTIQWCPGCGDFGILLALKKAIVKSEIDKEKIVIVSGIGCFGKLPHYLKTYGIETLHGRALPTATGVKLSNKDLCVVVLGGDGDGYGIGLGHFLHSMRRNIDLTYVVCNNETYGLTKGQTSPTSKKGFKTISTPQGSIETPVNPIPLSILGGSTFVARGFAGSIEQLSDIIAKGILHKGFSHIDVAQPCVSYNPKMSYQWYLKNSYSLEDDKNYNEKDKDLALKKAQESTQEKVALGVFYHNHTRETYLDDLPESHKLPLVEQEIEDIDIEKLLNKYE